MQFIDFEAEVFHDTDRLVFDHEEEVTGKKSFGHSQQGQGTFLNFYRKFHNQSHEISHA